MIKSVGIDLGGIGEHKVRCLDEKVQMCDGFGFDTLLLSLQPLGVLIDGHRGIIYTVNYDGKLA